MKTHNEQRAPQPRRRTQSGLPWLRWALMTIAMAFTLSALREQVSAQKAPPPPAETCEETTDSGRPCSLTEELWFCITVAMDAFDDCKEGEGLLGKVACYGLYVIDYWACFAEAPTEMFK